MDDLDHKILHNEKISHEIFLTWKFPDLWYTVVPTIRVENQALGVLVLVIKTSSYVHVYYSIIRTKMISKAGALQISSH